MYISSDHNYSPTKNSVNEIDVFIILNCESKEFYDAQEDGSKLDERMDGACIKIGYPLPKPSRATPYFLHRGPGIDRFILDIFQQVKLSGRRAKIYLSSYEYLRGLMHDYLLGECDSLGVSLEPLDNLFAEADREDDAHLIPDMSV